MLCEAPNVDVRTIGLEVQRLNLLPQLLKIRPRSRNPKYLRGRTWRLKLLAPVVDGTKFDDAYYKFSGYSSQAKPYSAFVSWHWLGAGATEMRYTLKSGIANAAAGLTNYRLNMKYQDAGLTIGRPVHGG